MQSEDALWVDFINGDSDSFEALVDRFHPALYHYGSKFSNDPELVKDCIQDVFLKVWERREHLEKSIPARPYLLASLRRRIHRKVNQHQIFNGLFPDHNYFVTDFSVEDTFITTETSRELTYKFQALLNQLPSRQKEIIMLKFFENLSREEIAMVMQINPQSVSNTLQKSLNWLRNNWSVVLVLLLSVVLQIPRLRSE